MIICFMASDMPEENRTASFKKKMMNSSSKRYSMNKRGRRSSKVMSLEIEDEHDAEELQSVEALRQALIAENLLLEKHDDYRMLLRLVSFLFYCDFLLLVYIPDGT